MGPRGWYRGQFAAPRSGSSTVGGTNAMTNARTFIGVLHSDAAVADRARKLGLTVSSSAAGRPTSSRTRRTARHQGHGEVHFGWVLEGRAIQDVWMIPRRRDRRPGAPVMPTAGNWYGTTLRV